MPTASPQLSFTLSNDTRMISVCRAFLEALCQTVDMDRRTIHAVVLATGEAVSNIIRHAHRDYPDAKIELRCRLLPDALEIILLD